MTRYILERLLLIVPLLLVLTIISFIILAALPGYGTAITGMLFEANEALGRGGYCISKAVRSSSKKVAAKRARVR